jgi:hypothetical protein
MSRLLFLHPEEICDRDRPSTAIIYCGNVGPSLDGVVGGMGDQGRGRAFQDREESGSDSMLKGVNIVNFLMN